jgi:hypothetical protein
VKKLMIRGAVALAGAAALAAGATAATPESGTIGKAAQKVQWSGTVTSGASHWVWGNADPSAPCQSGVTCDSFALKVADDGDVVIKLRNGGTSGTSSGANGAASVRVTLPDGEVAFATGESGPKTDLVLKIPNAKAGDYTVDGTPSFLNGGDFTATAEWFVPGGSAPKPIEEAPAPTEPQPQQQQPAPQTNTAFTIGAKVGKVSAKKAKKGKTVPVKVTTSRGIAEVVATLKKGSKTVGTAKVAPFGGSGTLKVKLAKALKKGSYTLTVIGRDGNVQAAKTLKVKVAK